MNCTCPDFDPAAFDGPEDHAAACASCPVHGTVLATAVKAAYGAMPPRPAYGSAGNCGCEHLPEEVAVL